MEFQNNNGTATKDEAAKTINNNAAANGAAKTNGTPVKGANGNGKGNKEAKPAAESPAPAPAAVKAEEPGKKEPQVEVQQLPPAGQAGREEAAPAKQELTLEAKIKAVNDLHRKTIQRLALIARLKTLEEFEVALMENNDELENNPYQGCKLIIEDDKRRQFITNTPGLIYMVSRFISDACEEKLAEIEGTINFPQS